MPEEFWQHLPSWLVWVFLAIMLAGFIGQRLSEAYPLVAKIIPFFGNYWRERSLREDRELEERAQGLAEEIAERMKPPDYEAIRKEVQHLVARINVLEEAEEINQAYLLADTRWHYAADIAIAETGSAIKFPSRIPYSEFVRKYREGWRPDISGELQPPTIVNNNH